MKCILLILFFLVSSINYAGTIDPNTPDKKHIKYGEKFNCVGRVFGVYANKNEFLASGVVIDRHHVLTAAHVVKNNISCSFMNSNDQIFCFKKVTYHKDFKEENFGKYDIAICYSEDPIELDFYPELYTENNEVGKLCSISGYGFYGNFINGAKDSDNTRRAGSNIIDYTYKDLLICTPSKPDSDKITELEFIIATGDSGGGLFIGEKLAGINSCVMAIDKKPDSSYTDEGGHTRISQYLDWIEENR